MSMKKIIAFLLGFSVVVGAMVLLYGDSKKLITGDMINNQGELEKLALDLLDGSVEEEALYNKYAMTYEISADSEMGIVEFVAVDTTEGFCYVAEGQPIAAGNVEEIMEHWYYFAGE